MRECIYTYRLALIPYPFFRYPYPPGGGGVPLLSSQPLRTRAGGISTTTRAAREGEGIECIYTEIELFDCIFVSIA